MYLVNRINPFWNLLTVAWSFVMMILLLEIHYFPEKILHEQQKMKEIVTIAYISWCTFSKPVYFFTWRTQNYVLLCLFCREFTHLGTFDSSRCCGGVPKLTNMRYACHPHDPGNRIMNSCNLISNSGVLQFAESMLACLHNPSVAILQSEWYIHKELGITFGDSSFISGLYSENYQSTDLTGYLATKTSECTTPSSSILTALTHPLFHRWLLISPSNIFQISYEVLLPWCSH